MLLKAQRNDLFRTLEEHGLNPAHFAIKHIPKSDTHLLECIDEPYYFTITLSSAVGYFELFGFPPVIASRSSIFTWPQVQDYFYQWAREVRSELDEPDLWEDLASNAKLFINATAADEKFTNAEIRELQGQLRALGQGFDSTTLPEAAKAALKATIEEAPAKAERFTKKEWQGWFLGAIVSQVTNLALSPEHVTTVYQLLKSTFSMLLLK